MGLIVAGERSGVGKTTVTLAMLAYLVQQGYAVQSFKVGPDYIDPMFHRYVTDRPCRNLDPLLTSEAYVQACFATHCRGAEAALVEGVMGLFDGAAGRGDFASTAHIARLLDLPILLVLDCSRLSQSIAALVHGYCSLDPRLQFAGVVLNRVGSDRHLEMLEAALAPFPLPILGVLRRHDAIQLPDRHLGLVPTNELPQLRAVVTQLAQLAADWFDWDQLLPILSVRPVVIAHQAAAPYPVLRPTLRIAIAQDAAFSFYYADNLELLERLGAELVFWSPLQDEQLPETIHGLYFGGGFPEMFAAQLAGNKKAREAVHAVIQAGLPTYAECGGLMYLCRQIIDFNGQGWDMVGIVPTVAAMSSAALGQPQTNRLTLGYRRVTALQDGVMLAKGAIAWGHEFHRSSLALASKHPLFEIQPNAMPGRKGQAKIPPLPSAYPTQEGWHLPNLHASYIHLHWGDRPELPKRFLAHCHQWLLRAQ